jgi:hypothetical protein
VHRRSSRYPPELRQRAVKMAADVRSSFTSDQAAIKAVAGILGIDNPDALRKWIKRARFNGNYDAPRRYVLKKFVFRSHTIIIGSIVTVLGGLALAYSQQFFGIGPPTADPSAPHLEIDQVTFSYGIWTGPIPEPFKIDIKILNTGPQLAAINSARVVIQKTAALQACAGQGEFPSTGSYPTELPTGPSPSSVVNIPISQLVPADGADRFDLLLRAQLAASSPGNIYLYRFHLYLTYNADNKQLDVGEIIMSYPAAPTAGQYFWSKYWAANPGAFDDMMSYNKRAEAFAKECDIRDSHILQPIISLPGMRPAELIGIPPQLAY